MTIFLLMVTLLMLAVCYYDLRFYLIPNWIVLLLLALYPAAVWLSPHPVDWQHSLMICAVTFGVGYLVFAMRWMGGGDIKLMIALSLYVGGARYLDYLFLVAIAGGVFSLVLLVVRAGITWLDQYFGWRFTLPEVLKPGAAIPYGVAIAGVFSYMAWSGALSLLKL